MEKLILNAEQQVIVDKALNDAYEAGKQDATFVMGGVSQLFAGAEKSLEKIRNQYFETEELKPKSEQSIKLKSFILEEVKDSPKDVKDLIKAVDEKDLVDRAELLTDLIIKVVKQMVNEKLLKPVDGTTVAAI